MLGLGIDLWLRPAASPGGGGNALDWGAANALEWGAGNELTWGA